MTGASNGFSPAALDYLRAHAIEPALARDADVSERDGALVYGFADADGRPYKRRYFLRSGDRRGPAGRKLCLGFIGGRPDGDAAAVLVCEGEGDALAAVSACAQLPLVVAAAPGASMPADRAARELVDAGCERAYLAGDGDKEGRKFNAKLAAALLECDVEPFVVPLPDGNDLADVLARAEDRERELLALLDAAEPWAPPVEEPVKGEEDEEPKRKPAQAVRLFAAFEAASADPFAPSLRQFVEDQGGICAFHTPDGSEWAEITRTIGDGTPDYLRVRSRAFRGYLADLFFRATGHEEAASGEALGAAVELIAARARNDGPELVVYRRIAAVPELGRVYLDLCDRERSIVEIGTNGWRVGRFPVAMFARSPGALALPVPKSGGSIDELRPFVNVAGEDDWRLLVAWLVAALRIPAAGIER